MGKLIILDHPIIQNKVSMLRNIKTGSKEFRELVEEIATLLCYEATRNIPLSKVDIDTPVCSMTTYGVKTKFAVIPILRAGIGMEQSITDFLPMSCVGHIGIWRDSDAMPVEYYCNLPKDIAFRIALVVDPMLATGGTASAAIDKLKAEGVKDIRLLCIISAPEGVKKINEDHPDVCIFTLAHDTHLNSHKYIVPGLGDAGDRLFGTNH